MILDQLSILASKKHSLLSCMKISTCALLFRHPVLYWNKSTCASLLIKTLCLFKPKPTLFGPLITFVNNFQNLF